MSETLVSKHVRGARWTPMERAEWMELYRACGQTVAAFCRTTEIAYASLSFWLRQSKAARAGEASERVEVPMAGLCSAAPSIVKVHLPCGAGLLRLPPGPIRGGSCSWFGHWPREGYKRCWT